LNPLDDAVLTVVALLDVPKLGRRKFHLHGKPHGRNELIALYLWIAYVESLPPGEQPDETKRRTRKHVSSHIQVLKGFMRDHPACEYSSYLEIASN
jgi:transcriptional enhancer factor